LLPDTNSQLGASGSELETLLPFYFYLLP